MSRYMLLLRNGNESDQELTPEQYQQLIQRYNDWTDRLRREGRLHGADELATGGLTVRARDGQPVVDGPYTETKEVVGGYYLIEAADEGEAAEIAKGCPIIEDGGLVEVRGIVEYA